jgi:hypothetical protein
MSATCHTGIVEMFVMCLRNLNLSMYFVGPLFYSFTIYQKKSLPKLDVFNTAFQACILCAADVTSTLHSNGGLVFIADITKLNYANVLCSLVIVLYSSFFTKFV